MRAVEVGDGKIATSLFTQRPRDEDAMDVGCGGGVHQTRVQCTFVIRVGCMLHVCVTVVIVESFLNQTHTHAHTRKMILFHRQPKFRQALR